jgi:outer membrane protein OmpA-like peptidoglycan-associated protein
MKKKFLVAFFFLNQLFLIGQNPSDKYKSLIKKADNFYRTKNYQTSALTYTQAFKINNWQASADARYNAACSWALAGIPDSAFYQLNFIVFKNNYLRYDQITTEADLRSLQKDKRWKPLLEVIKQNQVNKEAKLNKALIKTLDTVEREDQQYRSRVDDIKINYGADSKEMMELWRIINEKDSLNLIKVKAILDNQGWLGPDVIGDEGNTTLFLVIQHSDQKTQEKYLPLMRDAVKNSNAAAEDLALLEDRVALGQGKNQIYGSQIIKDAKTGKDTLAPIEDFANVDKRRASVGLEPIEYYAKQWGIVYKNSSVNKKLSFFSNADFSMAVEIHDSIVGPVKVNKGFGSKVEYKLDKDIKEENSAWFKFSIDHDTILTLDIVPDNPQDDFDFILFKCPSFLCINDIESGRIKPDRICFSQNYDKYGSTGISEYFTNTYIGAGPGSGYVSGLPVKAGDIYYLMVTYSNVYHSDPHDFTIYFYNYWPKKPKELRGKKTVVLQNVLFETNKTNLLKESFEPLDKLLEQLQTNKTMKIEIRGHTDNEGDEKLNQKLSEERAKTIVDYLVSKKIDKSRLSFKGFGSKQPIASNDTEEGRQKNRRVEFVIIAN